MVLAQKSPGTSAIPGDKTLGFVLDKELQHQSLAPLSWCRVLGQIQWEATPAAYSIAPALGHSRHRQR